METFTSFGVAFDSLAIFQFFQNFALSRLEYLWCLFQMPFRV